MRQLFALACLVAAACGSVDEKPGCTRSTDCAVGQFCARTADGNVCWPDAVPPVASAVTATCATSPCLRDGVLHVEATVADDEEVLSAEVVLDLDPGRPTPMTRAGARWVADVPLRGLPFEAFARDVVATVTARDGARNAGEPSSAPALPVTRLRWTYTATDALTVPAVMPDGTAVVGVANTSDQLLAVRPDGTKAWSLTVGTGQITAAPAIGERAIWVGSADGNLYGVALNGSGTLSGVVVNTGGSIVGSVAVVNADAAEWGLASSTSRRLGAAGHDGRVDTSSLGDEYTTGPAVAQDGRVYMASATATASATLRCFTFDAAFAERWTMGVGVNVSAPIGIDGAGAIWTGSQDALLYRTVPGATSGTAAQVGPALAGSVVDSPVILASGEVLVGDQTGALRRIRPDGTAAWADPPVLDGPPLAPLAMTGSAALFVAGSKAGTLYALDAEGLEVWRGTLAAGAELRAPNIFTPPGQPAGQVLSTAYVSSASGKLHAVIVDGELDAAAPWPKAFHDPRNTNNAGTEP